MYGKTDTVAREMKTGKVPFFIHIVFSLSLFFLNFYSEEKRDVWE